MGRVIEGKRVKQADAPLRTKRFVRGRKGKLESRGVKTKKLTTREKHLKGKTQGRTGRAVGYGVGAGGRGGR